MRTTDFATRTALNATEHAFEGAFCPARGQGLALSGSTMSPLVGQNAPSGTRSLVRFTS